VRPMSRACRSRSRRRCCCCSTRRARLASAPPPPWKLAAPPRRLPRRSSGRRRGQGSCSCPVSSSWLVYVVLFACFGRVAWWPVFFLGLCTLVPGPVFFLSGSRSRTL
jgi:hypothetical protein